MLRTAAVAVMSLAILAGCQGRAYTMANVELDPGRYEVVGPGQMSATGLSVLNIIPVQNTNKVSRAVERILQEHQGDALINISVQESWFWAFVLTGFTVDVSGTVVKKK
jgi:hypothetical protein